MVQGQWSWACSLEGHVNVDSTTSHDEVVKEVDFPNTSWQFERFFVLTADCFHYQVWLSYCCTLLLAPWLQSSVSLIRIV